MIKVLRAALLLLGVFYLLVGAGFLVDPARLGETFGVSGNGPPGLSTMRADFTAFFWVLGGTLAWSAWRGRGGALWAAAALIAIAVAGRGASLMLDGTYPGAARPMVVEGLTLLLALAGIRLLGRKA